MATTTTTDTSHLPHDVETSGGSFEHDHKTAEGVTVDHEGKEVHVSEGVERMQQIAAAGYADASGRKILYAVALCVFIMVRILSAPSFFSLDIELTVFLLMCAVLDVCASSSPLSLSPLVIDV
jgi:hypothetical protein